ncbi:MAG: competence/damage-inducible protein A [Bacteroidales bacterium]|nr:competence/damage-inducible protein A [Bacteroidales bacterium]
MKADIITIGDEILIGQITDTNSQWIAEQLNLVGFEIRQITTVGDDKLQIKKILNDISAQTDLVIITGGLGPTEDDITKETLTEYFNTDLKLNKDVLSDVKEFVQSKGFSLNERNIKQAEVPANCKIIRNENGTAPGMWFEKNNTVFISLPAVPFEMKELVKTKVLPLLGQKMTTSNVIHKTVLTYGIPESSLAELLSDWEKNLHEKIKLAYLPSPERIRLRFSMVCKEKDKALKIINAEIEKLKKIIGKAIFGYGDYFLQDATGKILKDRKSTLSVAESCTSGNVARLITSVPGSSEYFKGGIVAYSNEIKNKFLNVPEVLIKKYGAVSKEVVEAMVKGQKESFKTDYAVAISGIAGPGGGTPDKPVGTTWIAVAGDEGIISKKYTFGKMRDVNVRFASSKALDMLRKYISGYYFN